MSLQNIANHLAQHGRGDDKMLVHMTPKEVGGLQQLAQAHGGSLTINPHTGLPEAGFLDSLMPTLLGVGLSFIPGVGPLMAAGIVGGLQAARTGDIGKGLMAGLGAYGGAGLAGGLMGAGESALATQAGTAAGEAIGQAGGTEAAKMAAIDNASSAINPSNFDKFSAGVQGLGTETGRASVLSGLGGGMGAAQKGLMAAAPMLAAPQTTTQMPGKINTGRVQTKMVNPYTKQVYDVSNVPADQWGDRTFASERNNADLSKYVTAANGGLMGMAPGQFNYAQMQPAVDLHSSIGVNPSNASSTQPQNMASGGRVKRYAGETDGSVVTADPAALLNSSPAALANPQASNVVAFQALAQSDPAAYNSAISNAVKAAQTQYGGDNAQSQAAIAKEMGSWGVSPTALSGAIGAPISTVQNDYNNVTAGGPSTPWFSTDSLLNPGNSGVTNQQIVDAVTKAQATGGGGWNSLQQQMVNSGVSVPQAAKALGMTPEQFLADYKATTGVQAEGKTLGEAPSANPLGSTYDQQWARYMDSAMSAGTNPALAEQQIASITGLALDQIKQRYEAAEAAMHPKVITTNTGTTTGATTGTTTGTTGVTNLFNPATTATNAIQNASASTLARGVSGNTGAGIEGGGTVVNPNGTITESPVIPGIPKGGFTGMQNLIDSYTSRGGSTGYVPKAPTTIDEFNARYNTLSGGSKAAFDHLMGGAYSPVPYTPDNLVMKPYSESVLGIPQSAIIPATQKYFVDSKTHRLTLNPAYNAATGSNSNSSSSSGPALNSGKTISIPVANGTPPKNATQLKDYPGIYYGVDGLYYDANGNVTTDPTQQAANGGLMGMAHGGSTNEYNLGSYSDGGRLLRGPGDGVSDSIPATIGKGQPARLADGEFVVPARIVSELGNGSTEAGAKQLYAMMDRIQKARSRTVGKGKVATNTKAAKYLPA